MIGKDIMISIEKDEMINKLFESLLTNYEESLEDNKIFP